MGVRLFSKIKVCCSPTAGVIDEKSLHAVLRHSSCERPRYIHEQEVARVRRNSARQTEKSGPAREFLSSNSIGFWLVVLAVVYRCATSPFYFELTSVLPASNFRIQSRYRTKQKWEVNTRVIQPWRSMPEYWVQQNNARAYTGFSLFLDFLKLYLSRQLCLLFAHIIMYVIYPHIDLFCCCKNTNDLSR